MNTPEQNSPPNAKTASKDIKALVFPEVSWIDDASTAESLHKLYRYAEASGLDAISWYLRKKDGKRLFARTLRLGAIFLTTIGGLVPLLIAAKAPSFWPALDYAQFGYIALVLAGACVGLDRFFGFSSAWVRYISTAGLLQRALLEFHLDWAVLVSNWGREKSDTVKREAMLRRIQGFLQKIASEVEKETLEWAAEYRSNLAEVEKAARQQLESWRPGTVTLNVPNVGYFDDGVAVSLDGQICDRMTTTVYQISPVYPGQHIVTVTGQKGGKEVSASAPISVLSGQAVALSITLQSPA